MVSYINPFASVEQDSYYYDKTIDDVHVEVGSSNVIVDGIRNFMSIPLKLILWNSSVNSGNVSDETIQKMKEYLDENNLHDVHVSVNQYKPQAVWKRVFTNPKTSLLSKMTFGVVNSIVETVSIPKLTGFPGDHYNPLSNTIHLFSNDAAIGLHECGHAKDFNSRENPTLYILAAQTPIVGPVVTLMHEFIATNNVVNYLTQKNNKELLAHSFKVLVPAYATYVAASVLPDFNKKFAEFVQKCPTLSNCDAAFEEVNSAFKTYMLGLAAIILTGHVFGHILALAVKVEKDTNEVQTEKAPLDPVSV